MEDILDSEGTSVADNTWGTHEEASRTVEEEDHSHILAVEGRQEDVPPLAVDTCAGNIPQEDVLPDIP